MLLKVSAQYGEKLEFASVRSLIHCLAQILLAQECSKELWSEPDIKKCFIYLLSYCIHSSGKIRRHTQDELLPLIQLHHKEHLILISEYIVAYLENLCNQIDEKDYKDVSYFLAFVSRIVLFIDPSLYDSLLPLLFSLQSRGLEFMSGNSLRPIDIIFTSDEVVKASVVKDILDKILSMPPSPNTPLSDLLEFSRTVSFGARRLLLSNEPSGQTSLIKSTKCILTNLIQATPESSNALGEFLGDFYAQLQPEVPTLSSWHLDDSRRHFRSTPRLLPVHPSHHLRNLSSGIPPSAQRGHPPGRTSESRLV